MESGESSKASHWENPMKLIVKESKILDQMDHFTEMNCSKEWFPKFNQGNNILE